MNTALTEKTRDVILSMDLSPIDLHEISKKVAREVNVRMGIKDGGNINISLGRVLYDEERSEKRKKVLEAAIE